MPVTGGGKKKGSKKGSKKSSNKGTKKGPTLEQVKKQAKRAGIPLSKNGKAKKKAALQAALRHRK